MKATELHFGVLLSIMLYTLFLTFESADHKNLKGVQSNASDFSNNFPEVLFIVLQYSTKCLQLLSLYHSNESH